MKKKGGEAGLVTTELDEFVSLRQTVYLRLPG